MRFGWQRMERRRKKVGAIDITTEMWLKICVRARLHNNQATTMRSKLITSIVLLSLIKWKFYSVAQINLARRYTERSDQFDRIDAFKMELDQSVSLLILDYFNSFTTEIALTIQCPLFLRAFFYFYFAFVFATIESPTPDCLFPDKWCCLSAISGKAIN